MPNAIIFLLFNDNQTLDLIELPLPGSLPLHHVLCFPVRTVFNSCLSLHGSDSREGAEFFLVLRDLYHIMKMKEKSNILISLRSLS